MIFLFSPALFPPEQSACSRVRPWLWCPWSIRSKSLFAGPNNETRIAPHVEEEPMKNKQTRTKAGMSVKRKPQPVLMFRHLAVAVAAASAFALSAGHAQTIAPAFASDYSLVDLGSVPQVPPSYGGITFLNGDPNTLLLGGTANVAGGAIYRIGVMRDADNHITGFSGPASFVSTAPYIDGGLAYGPNGVLFYTGYPVNTLGEIEPVGMIPAKILDLSSLGIFSSVGTVQFVPPGFPDAGAIRISSFDGGGFYSGVLSPDGAGTFDLSGAMLRSNTGGGPEGIVYVPAGAPVFAGPSVLISEYNAGQVSAYALDGNGIPDPNSRQDFITDLNGAEGAVIDPLSNDFLFSTFGGGDRVIVVRGFGAPQLLTLTGAVSRKTHGSVGEFDLSLVLDPPSNATVEPRNGGPTQIIFTFSQDIAVADGTLDSNEFMITNADFGSALIGGGTLTLNLASVVDQSVVDIAVNGITDLNGNPLSGNNELNIRALLGDTNQNQAVEKPDLQLIKNHAGEALDQASGNFLFDLDLDGVIDKLDGRVTKKNRHHTVP